MTNKKNTIIYLGDAQQVLVGRQNLYLNEEGIVKVERGSWEDVLCQSYKLRNLEELYNKYCGEKEDLKTAYIWLQEVEKVLNSKIEKLEKENEVLKKEKENLINSNKTNNKAIKKPKTNKK